MGWGMPQTIVLHQLGHALWKCTILKPNMIGVGHATKNNGIIEWQEVCHVTKICSIYLTHRNKVLLGHECCSW
jgi:hypothetical protein